MFIIPNSGLPWCSASRLCWHENCLWEHLSWEKMLKLAQACTLAGMSWSVVAVSSGSLPSPWCFVVHGLPPAAFSPVKVYLSLQGWHGRLPCFCLIHPLLASQTGNNWQCVWWWLLSCQLLLHMLQGSYLGCLSSDVDATHNNSYRESTFGITVSNCMVWAELKEFTPFLLMG